MPPAIAPMVPQLNYDIFSAIGREAALLFDPESVELRSARYWDVEEFKRTLFQRARTLSNFSLVCKSWRRAAQEELNSFVLFTSRNQWYVLESLEALAAQRPVYLRRIVLLSTGFKDGPSVLSKLFALEVQVELVESWDSFLAVDALCELKGPSVPSCVAERADPVAGLRKVRLFGTRLHVGRTIPYTPSPIHLESLVVHGTSNAPAEHATWQLLRDHVASVDHLTLKAPKTGGVAWGFILSSEVLSTLESWLPTVSRLDLDLPSSPQFNLVDELARLIPSAKNLNDLTLPYSHLIDALPYLPHSLTTLSLRPSSPPLDAEFKALRECMTCFPLDELKVLYVEQMGLERMGSASALGDLVAVAKLAGVEVRGERFGGPMEARYRF